MRYTAKIEDYEDCQRIQRVLACAGIEASLLECQDLWRMHSKVKMEAQWMHLPVEDHRILKHLAPFIEERIGKQWP